MNGGILNGLAGKALSIFGAFVLVFACIYVFTKDAGDTANLAKKTTHAISVGFFSVTGSFSEIDDARAEVEPYVADEPQSKKKS